MAPPNTPSPAPKKPAAAAPKAAPAKPSAAPAKGDGKKPAGIKKGSTAAPVKANMVGKTTGRRIGQVLVDLEGIARLAVEESGFDVERIGQAMRRIDAHHQGAISEARELKASGRGETGLAYASFAAEEKDAHSFIVAPAAPCSIPLDERQRGTGGGSLV